jgi:hypothetical protein
MFNVDISSRKGGEKIDFSVIKKIVVFPLESWMRLLLDFEHDVARQDTRHLITFTTEFDFVTAFHASIDMHM